MIDITNEQLVPIRQVPQRLPPHSNGKTVHVSAVYRWIQRGVRGVQLEAIRIGGTTYTSAEALQRFADQLTGRTKPVPPELTPPVSRRRQIDRASRQVKGIIGDV